MAWLKGMPRREFTLLTIERERSGRYSVRQPVESSGASAAVLAKPVKVRELGSELRMGKRLSTLAFIFAIYSPFDEHTLTFAARQVHLEAHSKLMKTYNLWELIRGACQDGSENTKRTPLRGNERSESALRMATMRTESLLSVLAEQFLPVLDKADQHHDRRSHETKKEHHFQHAHSKSGQYHPLDSTAGECFTLALVCARQLRRGQSHGPQQPSPPPCSNFRSRSPARCRLGAQFSHGSAWFRCCGHCFPIPTSAIHCAADSSSDISA